MNRQTRSKTKKQEMAADSAADSSTKLDDILAKMDVLIQAKDQMLCKLNKVEQIQSSIVQDVDKLKERMETANLSIQESEAKLKTKADQSDLDILKSKMDDLENRSKRNNVVVWGVKEGCESDFSSIEEFIEKELFTNHMQLEEGIEVMRAHRTGVKRNSSNSDTPKPRPIHVCLLRYTDKSYILKNAAAKLKNNKYKDFSVFISDDVSRRVRIERAELRKNHLPRIKETENVLFAFIPWSIPAQILYKENGTDKLKSFTLPEM